VSFSFFFLFLCSVGCWLFLLRPLPAPSSLSFPPLRRAPSSLVAAPPCPPWAIFYALPQSPQILQAYPDESVAWTATSPKSSMFFSLPSPPPRRINLSGPDRHPEFTQLFDLEIFPFPTQDTVFCVIEKREWWGAPAAATAGITGKGPFRDGIHRRAISPLRF